MALLSTSRRAPGVPLVLAGAGSVALLTLVVSLVLAGAEPVPAPAGLPDAGLVPAWALRVFRLALDLAAVVTLGCLVTAGALVRPGPDGTLGAEGREMARTAGRAAAAWMVAAAVSLVLTAADLTGTPPSELAAPALLTVAGTAAGRALLVAAALAGVVAVAARRLRSPTGALVLVGLGLAGLLPVGVAGHASTAGDHDVAVSALVVHVGAAAGWVGGLVGLLLLARRAPGLLPGAAHRFSTLALVAFLAVGGSGLLVAVTRLGTSSSTWVSGYGALVLTKAGALVLLGLAGLGHRRRTLPQLAGQRSTAFARLAGAELLLMAAATGIAAALSRTPAPVLPVVAEPVHGDGHSTLPSRIDPVSVGELLTAWRINAVLVLVLGLALGTYLTGVRTLAARHEDWPRARTAAFAAGIVLGVVATCSGIATYAPAMVSVQVAQLLLLLVAVPPLLVLGAPVTLWLRLRGATEAQRRPVLRVLSDPYLGAGLTCLLLLGLYRSPLIEVSLSSSWVHLAVLLAALLAGLLLFWPVLRVDPAPGARSGTETAACVAAVAATLVLLAVQLRYGDQLLAAVWFLELRWSWVDPVADQRLSGALVGVAAAALIVVAVLRLLPIRRPATRPR